MATCLPIYSPCSTTLQLVHLKHQMCHCFSSAINACPSRKSSAQPAHSGNFEKRPWHRQSSSTRSKTRKLECAVHHIPARFEGENPMFFPATFSLAGLHLDLHACGEWVIECACYTRTKIARTPGNKALRAHKWVEATNKIELIWTIPWLAKYERKKNRPFLALPKGALNAQHL